MPQPDHLDPSAYAADGGPVGILLIHGYLGSVAHTRPMGEYLAARDLTVRCPLLPGHGTSPEDLTRIHRQEWIEEVESSLSDLESRCLYVFVGGQSMGALLSLWLGVAHLDIAGLLLMSPAVKMQNQWLFPLTRVARYLPKYIPPGIMEEEAFGDPGAVDRVWNYDRYALWGAAELYLLQRRACEMMPQIHQPALIFQGKLDNWVSPDAAQIVYDNLASTDKTLVWLEHSGHNLLADGERESVWARSYEWMMERVSPHRSW